ncbi:hypothetical protein SAMN02910292_02537 [Lachnospiraceae bacterium XBB2008]|nr:hypothetical protein SAMN02910292_02537 [Lachnospiraceae bacterium XBB2008]
MEQKDFLSAQQIDERKRSDMKNDIPTTEYGTSNSAAMNKSNRD